MPASAAELRTRYPQLRGLADETIEARALDFEDALRRRYAVQDTPDADAALLHVVLAHFGWWTQRMDHLKAEGLSTGGASAQYGALPWPADIDAALAPYSDRPAVPPRTQSVPNRYVW